MLQSLREDLLHDVKSKDLRVIIISGTSVTKRRLGGGAREGAETG